MTKSTVSLSGVALVVLALMGPGCNAILGNEKGSLDAGATPTVAAIDASAAPLTCSSDKKICVGQCVGKLDPLFGCAAEPTSKAGCDACKPANAKADCSGAGHLCDFEQCVSGYGDCNGNHADGCEADLSNPEHCGTCNTKCSGQKPFCAPGGATGFDCTATCVAPLDDCGSGKQCFDKNKSVANCGTCGHDCKDDAPSHGVPVCASGVCTFICAMGSHRCSGNPDTCENDVDAKHCGARCVACSPMNVKTPTCDANACGYDTCVDGFLDCDGDRSNGCESNPLTDVDNCGGCAGTSTGSNGTDGSGTKCSCGTLNNSAYCCVGTCACSTPTGPILSCL